MTLRLSAASGHDKSGFDRRFILLRAATPASDRPWHRQPHVLNPASLSINRQARRRVKTSRTDVDGLIRALAALVQGERHVCRLVARALDVARFRTDRTVFTLRSGSRVEYVEVQAKKDTMEVAARAKVLSERLNATAVYVDVIGVGAGVVDKLKLDGVEVVAVNAAEVAPNRSANKDDAQGKIMRDYLWIEMARWLREDEPAFLVDKDMAEDLAGELASVKYGIDGKGYLTVEMKDQMRKRLGRSPDLAELPGADVRPEARLRHPGLLPTNV